MVAIKFVNALAFECACRVRPFCCKSPGYFIGLCRQVFIELADPFPGRQIARLLGIEQGSRQQDIDQYGIDALASDFRTEGFRCFVKPDVTPPEPGGRGFEQVSTDLGGRSCRNMHNADKNHDTPRISLYGHKPLMHGRRSGEARGPKHGGEGPGAAASVVYTRQSRHCGARLARISEGRLLQDGAELQLFLILLSRGGRRVAGGRAAPR
jgi:hypothetical protein